jgi:CRP-like cAMP-binding protein
MIPDRTRMSDLKGELVSTAAQGNGHSPGGDVPTPDRVESDPVEAIRDQLEDLIRPLQLKRAELEVELSEIASKEARINNAIGALDGGRPGAKTPRRRTHEEVGENSGRNWVPSEDKIAKVLVALQGVRSEPATTAQLAERAGLARETVNRALRVLREREEARMVGQAGQGNARLYLPMET